MSSLAAFEQQAVAKQWVALASTVAGVSNRARQLLSCHTKPFHSTEVADYMWLITSMLLAMSLAISCLCHVAL